MKRPGVGQAKVDLQSASPTVRRQKDNSSWNGHSDGKSSRWNLREVCVFEDNDNDHRRRRKLTQSSETVSHSSALETAGVPLAVWTLDSDCVPRLAAG